MNQSGSDVAFAFAPIYTLIGILVNIQREKKKKRSGNIQYTPTPNPPLHIYALFQGDQQSGIMDQAFEKEQSNIFSIIIHHKRLRQLRYMLFIYYVSYIYKCAI